MSRMTVIRQIIFVDDLAVVPVQQARRLPREAFGPWRHPRDANPPRARPQPRLGPQPRAGRTRSQRIGDVIDIVLPFLPIIGPAIGVGELLDDLFDPSFVPDPDPWKIPANYVRIQGPCATSPGNPPYPDADRYIGPAMRYHVATSISCVSGQTPGTYVLPGQYIPILWPGFALESLGHTTVSTVRARIDRPLWRRVSGDVGFTWNPNVSGVLPVPGVPVGAPALNPNVARGLPSPLLVEPLSEVAPPEPDQWQWRSDGPPNPPPRHHCREPLRGRGCGRGRNKERKVQSRSARIGMAIFCALDWLSEIAEIVDALYDALPPDVKKRWGRGRDGRGFIDQAGQYGIDGADWKLQALMHNWHKVDMNAGLENIVKNAVEDQLIGAVQRKMPRNVINAFERTLPKGKEVSPELYASQFVDWLFEEGM